jgi:5-methylcytosine-specific restriction endonuclease McrA
VIPPTVQYVATVAPPAPRTRRVSAPRRTPAPPFASLDAATQRLVVTTKLAKYRSRALPQALKKQAQAITLRDCNHQCVYCASPLTLTTITLDHVQPLAKGGSNGLENLVAACSVCNHFKDNQHQDAWFDDNLWAARRFVRIAIHVDPALMKSAANALRGPYADVVRDAE